MREQTLPAGAVGVDSTPGAGGEARHPTTLTYIKVATILAVITAVEIAVFYLDFPQAAFLTVFLGLSAVKFAIVVLFYMHLKFDNVLFSRLFAGGLGLAVVAGLALLTLFRVIID